ncbi:MAG: hypothetical protein ABSE73_21460 [Planctomycetota bacterium]
MPCRLEVGDTAGWKPALRRLRRTLFLAALLAGSAAPPCGWNAGAAEGAEAGGRAPRRFGTVHPSDVQILQGTVLLTPGTQFALTQIVLGKKEKADVPFTQLRSFNVDIVKEMAFSPFTRNEELEAERMMQPYKWDRQDRDKRIADGIPYPVRELVCVVKFTSGEEITGIINSTVLYVELREKVQDMPSGTKRFILKSKQTGDPGQKLEDLVYVSRIRMLDEGREIPAKTCLELASKLGPDDIISVMTSDSLEAVPIKPGDKPGRYEVSATLGESVLVGAKKGEKYVAGWPTEGTQKTPLFEEVEKKVMTFRDYYNERKMLGVMSNEDGTRILCLVSLRRRVPANADPTSGEFDADGKKMEFFRLSIWQWKRDVNTKEMLLQRRGSFFRVRVDAEKPTPPAEVAPELWPVVNKNGVLAVGKAAQE